MSAGGGNSSSSPTQAALGPASVFASSMQDFSRVFSASTSNQVGQQRVEPSPTIHPDDTFQDQSAGSWDAFGEGDGLEDDEDDHVSSFEGDDIGNPWKTVGWRPRTSSFARGYVDTRPRRTRHQPFTDDLNGELSPVNPHALTIPLPDSPHPDTRSNRFALLSEDEDGDVVPPDGMAMEGVEDGGVKEESCDPSRLDWQSARRPHFEATAPRPSTYNQTFAGSDHKFSPMAEDDPQSLPEGAPAQVPLGPSFGPTPHSYFPPQMQAYQAFPYAQTGMFGPSGPFPQYGFPYQAPYAPPQQTMAFAPQQQNVFPQQPFGNQFPQQPFAPAFPPSVQNFPPQFQQPPQQALERRTLPSTDKCEMLKGSSNYGVWALWVRNMTKNIGLLSHLSKGDELGLRPTELPSYPPADPTDAWTSRIHESWWRDDDTVQHIVTSRLDPAILMGLPNVVPGTNRPVSARDMFEHLHRTYGAGLPSATLSKWKELMGRKDVSPHALPKFIADYREAYGAMLANHQPVTESTVMIAISESLPEVGVFASIARELRDDADRGNLRHPHSVFESVDKEATRYIAKHPQSTKQKTSNTKSSSSNSSSKTPRSKCTNCGREGHEAPRCYQPGGAMEGRADEVRAEVRTRRSRAPTGVVAVASDTRNLPDAPAANVATVVVADAVCEEFDCYDVAMVVGAGTIFPEGYELMLDSGCSPMLFNKPNVFWDFRDTQAKNLTTANCGELRARGNGLVKLLGKGLGPNGQDIIINVRNARYAPDAPCHLISVGLLQEKGIGLEFAPAPDTRTTIRFGPLTPWSGHGIEARRWGVLAFMPMTVLIPPSPASVEVVTSVPRPILTAPLPPPSLLEDGTTDGGVPDSEYSDEESSSEGVVAPVTEPATEDIWHERLSHLGREATRRFLTGNYATGVEYVEGSGEKICPPCIVGKGSKIPVPNPGSRAKGLLDLLHIDICGPFNVTSSSGPVRGQHKYFMVVLDDWSNYANTILLKDRTGAGVLKEFQKLKRRWESRTGRKVKAIRMDNAKEFVEGKFAEFLKTEGVEIQKVAPEEHEQNGKAERYIRTLQDDMHALIAGSLLPMSKWADAVLAAQHTRNRVPTSTLPINVTPYERMWGMKPDASTLKAWGCLAWIRIPPEKRTKESHRNEPAIFVGYEQPRKGWWFLRMDGSYRFTSQARFDEGTQGRLQKNPTPTGMPPKSSGQPPPEEVEEPDPSNTAERRAERLASLRRGVRADRSQTAGVSMFLTMDNGQEVMVDHEQACFLVEESKDECSFEPLLTCEADALESVFIATRDDSKSFTRVYTLDLSKPPQSYNEIRLRSDAPVWLKAMCREKDGLFDMGTFERCYLPAGRKAIGVKWVYAYKYDENGRIIIGMEKARLVVQGFRQRPEDYGRTYAPVAKMPSIRALLAWATKKDWEIYSFDVKTAFLHAHLTDDVYVKQIPGFEEEDPRIVYKLKRALYGLKQSAFEFYAFFKSHLMSLGMFPCDVDPAVFMGIWKTPPNPSIPMPEGQPFLVLIVSMHVDDGLTITNSPPLYRWFIQELLKKVKVKDLGPVSLFLGIHIIRDRPNRRLWMSQRSYIREILSDAKMLDARPLNVPLPHSINALPKAKPNALFGVRDEDIEPMYLKIVGWLMYLAVCTRPDIAYAAAALGQHSANPSREHLVAARNVLRYLAGTQDLSLSYPAPKNPKLLSSTTSPVRLETCAVSDADWANDATDRKSVSGYVVYYMDGLVSWSATKQKTVALSSTEAELYSITNLLREVLWFKMFVKSLRLPCPSPFPMFSDNQSAVTMIESEAINSRSKHIDVRHHFIRDQVREGVVVTGWLPTEDNTADIFTKALGHVKFVHHRAFLGLVPLPSSFSDA